MTLTPEQFNKLTTKEEHQQLEKKVDDIGENVKKILTAVDAIAKKHETFEQELTSNQAAHDRFQKEINSIKTHIKLNA